VSAETTDNAIHALFFDRVLASKRNLIAIETAEVAQVIEQFRQLARRSGQSVYQWQEEAGIVSMRESEVRVPGSKRMTDALRYILQSMHFGIYLFTDVGSQLRPPNTGLLRQIGRIHVGNERKVVFIGKSFEIPDSLDDLVERVTHEAVRPVRPRLRDGRWVI